MLSESEILNAIDELNEVLKITKSRRLVITTEYIEYIINTLEWVLGKVDEPLFKKDFIRGYLHED